MTEMVQKAAELDGPAMVKFVKRAAWNREMSAHDIDRLTTARVKMLERAGERDDAATARLCFGPNADPVCTELMRQRTIAQMQAPMG
jgi:hypothetical protein